MTAKLFIVFLCAAIGAAAGLAVMRLYKRTQRYMEGVCAMIGELKRNIAYRRDSVAGILAAFSTDSAQLRRHIGEYIEYVGKKDGELKLSRGALPAAAHRRAVELFCSLGRADGSTQMDELAAFASMFDGMRAEAEARSQKYGPLAVKLGFLFGAGVGILLL